MNRALIVAGERQTGERFQQTLSESGFQTAVVWNPMQMVEFCRQHVPDFMVVDLDLAEHGLWSAIQAVRGIGTLANIPYIGISSVGDPQVLEKAKAAGFGSIFPSQESVNSVVDELKDHMERNQPEPELDDSADPVTRDPSLNKLREIARDIVVTTHRLRELVPEYGEDGPELFGYIQTAGTAIRKKLNEAEDFSLHDKELRHDFRNMIGSVTGFAELILMEEGISPESSQGLSRLRERSREFVDILDEQKASADA